MVGESEGIVVPCAAVSKELRKSTTSHTKLHHSRLGSLNFPFGLFGDIAGAWDSTDDVRGLAALLVGGPSLVDCWLFFTFALFLTNELSSEMMDLAPRFGLGMAPNINSVLT